MVDDPEALTKLVFQAIHLTGVRAIVSKGWGNLGGLAIPPPPDTFMIDDCPHDWLFDRVSCVVHHGGAGTTSAAVAAGRPCVVVPFFGDQPFWGNMVFRAGAAPKPLPYSALTATALADAITAALRPGVLQNARELGERIREERGCERGAQSFHDHLPMGNMGCSLVPRRVAVWRVRKSGIRLSAMAATVLRKADLVDFNGLEMCVKTFTPIVCYIHGLKEAATDLVSTASVPGPGNRSQAGFRPSLISSTTPSKASAKLAPSSYGSRTLVRLGTKHLKPGSRRLSIHQHHPGHRPRTRLQIQKTKVTKLWAPAPPKEWVGSSKPLREHPWLSPSPWHKAPTMRPRCGEIRL